MTRELLNDQAKVSEAAIAEAGECLATVTAVRLATEMERTAETLRAAAERLAQFSGQVTLLQNESLPKMREAQKGVEAALLGRREALSSQGTLLSELGQILAAETKAIASASCSQRTASLKGAERISEAAESIAATSTLAMSRIDEAARRIEDEAPANGAQMTLQAPLEAAQRDLADLVEIQDAEDLLQLIEVSKRASGDEDLEARLGGIERRLEVAGAEFREPVENLREELGPIVAELGGTIEDDGAIVPQDTIIFEQGSVEITPVIRDLLNKICELWMRRMMIAKAQVSSDLIEGHGSRECRTGTSSDETYLSNPALSQARSQAVLDACSRIVHDAAVRA